MSVSLEQLKQIIEGALLAAGQPLSIDQMLALFPEGAPQPEKQDVHAALLELSSDCANRGVELKEVASGFRYQVKQEVAPWVARLWEERPAKYSRAVMETLALIAYRQPITRGEIEDVRGVTVSSQIIKSLLEREWVRVIGHRDVPGKPALYGTTRQFLDYFNVKSLSDLPTLAEIRSIESIERELEFGDKESDKNEAEQVEKQKPELSAASVAMPEQSELDAESEHIEPDDIGEIVHDESELEPQSLDTDEMSELVLDSPDESSRG